ncbi:Transcription regulator HTH, GntR [Syntrophomonas zehnderi OL-4]|uniref:Transcription regulator HTH, GntR n=1 Tax=Syntrophomonas zehnderi OL-4 TaxID=690567 RepID=A0A0E3W2K8_9FIRM|nr:GntR family transcriptional regulator [Syntrophomonas zehnderi]CFX06210.1 Transcription regulator HTH, GntR [Syntrophomonas zehnderi OL-4]CFX33599.1 Transcription regulator HTH, GntR [Syntrophomonas zehnderi OL-4]
MFDLDLRSRAPIYEQLTEKIIELIVNGVLKPDEQLPAVRVLAAELTVNPNTIQKAYKELDHRGYIYSLPGKGSFVRPAIPEDHTLRLQSLEHDLKRIIAQMLYLGLSADQIENLVKHLISTNKGGSSHD